MVILSIPEYSGEVTGDLGEGKLSVNTSDAALLRRRTAAFEDGRPTGLEITFGGGKKLFFGASVSASFFSESRNGPQNRLACR